MQELWRVLVRSVLDGEGLASAPLAGGLLAHQAPMTPRTVEPSAYGQLCAEEGDAQVRDARPCPRPSSLSTVRVPWGSADTSGHAPQKQPPNCGMPVSPTKCSPCPDSFQYAQRCGVALQQACVKRIDDRDMTDGSGFARCG